MKEKEQVENYLMASMMTTRNILMIYLKTSHFVLIALGLQIHVMVFVLKILGMYVCKSHYTMYVTI